MVIGSRFVKEGASKFRSTALRRLGINIISFVIKLKTGKKIYDTTSGFRAADKGVIEQFVNYYPTEYPEPISTVHVLINDCTVSEVPVEMKPRVAGVSSISKFKSVYYMINVILSILLMKGKRRWVRH